MIKLKCQNPSCAYCYSVSPKELEEYGKLYHNICMICGKRLDVVNLEEIIKKDIETKVKEYVDLWFKTLGIEYTLEMIERNKNQACYRFYKTELLRRGFKLK